MLAMTSLSRSARLYQERHEPQFETTRRAPGPRADLGRNAVHRLPLHPPLPAPAALHEEACKPPDCAGTSPWPYGQGEEYIT